MIDDIIEIMYKEARARNSKHPMDAMISVLNDVSNKVYSVFVEYLDTERRKREHEKKAHL